MCNEEMIKMIISNGVGQSYESLFHATKSVTMSV